MIEVRGLTKHYGTFVAVDDLSFSVAPGEILGLVGPNGAGKTTTLRCLVGILRPTSGTLSVGGYDLVAQPVEAKRRLAWLPDEPHLFEYLTVDEHLTLTARLYHAPDAVARGKALLEELEIADKAGALPGELSRGMKQKLAIACGLLHDPSAIFLDEPLTGLDPLGIRRMKQTIVERKRRGAALVVSSHLLHLVEEIADRVLILNAGKRAAYGSLEEIRAQAPGLSRDANLEDIFLTVTGKGEGPHA
ncbi:MAG: ABC transporter ATP-binding protein [Candidatus Eiseniibacteriota bacterium]